MIVTREGKTAFTKTFISFNCSSRSRRYVLSAGVSTFCRQITPIRNYMQLVQSYFDFERYKTGRIWFISSCLMSEYAVATITRRCPREA